MVSSVRWLAGGLVLTLSVGSCGAPTLTSGGDAPPVWTHEPGGFASLTDQPWNAMVDAAWRRRSSSNDRIVEDAGAPLSPRGVLEYLYPAGFTGGTAPATHYVSLGQTREAFIGLQWKPSEPWQGHSSGVNKIHFVYLAGGGDVAMVMYGPDGGPYDLRVLPQWPEHTRGWLTSTTSHPLRTGAWHGIEWHLKYETRPGAGDGIIRWWLDGTLLGSYQDLHFPADAGFAEYQISPTWGGIGDTKRQADSYRFDHSYISVPAAALRR